LSLSSVDTVTFSELAVGIGINGSNRDYGDIVNSGPCHHAPDMRQNPPVVPDAGISIGKQKISLGIYIHQDPPSFRSDELQYHI
jgi:hypothetical protein